MPVTLIDDIPFKPSLSGPALGEAVSQAELQFLRDLVGGASDAPPQKEGSAKYQSSTLTVEQANATLCCNGCAWRRSGLGQKRTFSNVRRMSALPPTADIHRDSRNVRFGSITDMTP
jgi:hypothetical protein